MPAKQKAVFALLTVSAIWGIASVAIVYTLNYIPPISFLYIRFLIPAVILYFFVKKELKNLLHKVTLKKLLTKPFTKKSAVNYFKEEVHSIYDVRSLFLMGVLGSTVNLGILFFAYQYVTAIEGAMIYSTAPIWVMLSGVIFLKEKVTKREVMGLFICILGFLLVVIFPAFQDSEGLSYSVLGNFLMVLATAGWVAYSVISKNVFNHGKKYSPQLITFFTFFSGAVTLAPFATYEIFTTQIDFSMALAGILYMSIFSSFIAYWLFEYGVQQLNVGKASVFQYIQPVFTIPVAILILKESFSIWQLIGGLVIAIGIYFAESKRHTRSVSSSRPPKS